MHPAELAAIEAILADLDRAWEEAMNRSDRASDDGAYGVANNYAIRAHGINQATEIVKGYLR